MEAITSRARRLTILAIVVSLAGIAACSLIMTPGRFGITPGEPEAAE